MDSDDFDERREATCSPEMVQRVARDIARRTATEHDILLSDLLCAAWPTPTSQMQ